MTERLLAAFRAADRLPPAVQDELAGRILADIAPELVYARPRRASANIGRPAPEPVRV